MNRHILTLAMFSAMIGGHQAAYASGFGAELTGGKSAGTWGAEIGVGYGLAIGPISIKPVVGAFIYKGDNDRYYNQTLNNGQTRCRDSTNGQFAKDRLCNDTAALFYGKVEATVTIPAVAELGVGARYLDEKVRPYGIVAVPIAPKIKFVGAGGEDYFSAGLRVGF